VNWPSISLRWLIPALIVVPFSVVAVLSYYLAVDEKIGNLLEESERELRGSVAVLARSAERLTRSDPSLLRQEITLLALESKLAGGAVVDEQGLVLHSTQFAAIGDRLVH